MKTVTRAFLRYLYRRKSLSFLQLMGIAVGVAAAALVLSPGEAWAEAKKQGRKGRAGPIGGLDSDDPTQVAAAIEALEKRGGPAAVKELIRRIRDGLPPSLLEQAVDAIVAVGGKPAGKCPIPRKSTGKIPREFPGRSGGTSRVAVSHDIPQVYR